ncbi:stalk domain-containing protein [Saccharibacillus sp. CPCC 101409]|uniref:stalk domain-containing protein n=1 Tax=Saccharibacillus sp. CPCC 101409 TaxID=3058041 RepID=UPI002673B0F5|nr:stalk domain-containing protein [Saccharibacillus sp. CPCC 101409]MDO3409226.1 stalk domain-containing protein [Saccharibacillus sp. CPCC 101409]
MNAKKRTLVIGLAAALGFSAASPPPASAAEKNIKDFTANSIVKTDGTYWSWGRPSPVPTRLANAQNIRKVFANDGTDYYLENADGTLLFLTPGTRTTKPSYETVSGLRDVDHFRYYGEAVAIAKNGRAFVTDLLDSEDRFPDYTKFVPIEGIDNAADASPYVEYSSGTSKDHWLLLKKDGTVWRDTDELAGFKPIPNLSGVTAISENAALKKDGTVWALPTSYDKSLPVSVPSAAQIKGLSGIRSINGGGYDNTVLAIDGSGSLWFKGSTLTGFSDSATTNDQGAAFRLTGVKNVKSAYLIDRRLVAFTHDGGVYQTSTDVQKLSAGASFKTIAAGIQRVEDGGRHIIMQKKDGSLLGWGINKNGDLGYGDFEFSYEKAVPVQPAVYVTLNGEDLELSGGVVTRGNQSFVPLRSVFEKLGAAVTFDSSSKKVTVSRAENGKTTSIVIDTNKGTASVNGKAVKLEQPAFAISGVTYLPLRLISENLGAKVTWVKAEDKVEITMK